MAHTALPTWYFGYFLRSKDRVFSEVLNSEFSVVWKYLQKSVFSVVIQAQCITWTILRLIDMSFIVVLYFLHHMTNLCMYIGTFILNLFPVLTKYACLKEANVHSFLNFTGQWRPIALFLATIYEGSSVKRHRVHLIGMQLRDCMVQKNKWF